MMKKLFMDIDNLLRGGFTGREDLAAGRIKAPLGMLIMAGLILGVIYGVFMGLYGVFRPQNPTFLQLVATTLKVPLLFLLTLFVAFPSLYVFSALSRSRLQANETFRLLLVAIAVNLALLASFGPVTAFFTMSTDSYHFMVVLNVIFFGTSGLVGLGFLRRALEAVFFPVADNPVHDEPGEVEPDGGGEGVAGSRVGVADEKEPADTTRLPKGRHARSPEAKRPRTIFMIWMVIYGIVGAQMGWILRPFIGSPDLPFALFRQRESSFFESILQHIARLFS